MKYASDAERDMLPGTNVLRNIPNITDPRKLAEFERNAVAWRSGSVPSGKFDVEHLKAIHKHLFQDVYAWAGEFREVPLAKGSSRFAQPQYIEQEIKKLLSKAEFQHPSILGAEKFPDFLTEVIVELNAIHPFREGNGRTVRAFARELCRHCGYTLDLSSICGPDWLDASIRGFQGDSTPMRTLIARAVQQVRERSLEP